MLRRIINNNNTKQQSPQQIVSSSFSALSFATTSSIVVDSIRKNSFVPTKSLLSLPTPSSSDPTPKEGLRRLKDWAFRKYYNLTGKTPSVKKLRKQIKNKDGIQKAAAVIVVAPQPPSVIAVGGKKGEVYAGEKFKILFVARSTAQTHTTDTEDVKAHTEDKIYDFPGGRVEPEDVALCDHDRSLLEGLTMHYGSTMPWIPERVTIIRELADELGVVLDQHTNLRSRRYTEPTFIGIGKLVPFAENISPVQDAERRLDMSYFLLQVSHDAPEELPFTYNWNNRDQDQEERDVIDAKWLTVEEALNMHNAIGSGFKLAPFTQLLIHRIGQFPTSGSLMTTHSLKHRNDVMEMVISEPFVEISDGNFNMHFQREQMPDMPCGKHLLGTLGYELPSDYVEMGSRAALHATVGSFRANRNIIEVSKKKAERLENLNKKKQQDSDEALKSSSSSSFQFRENPVATDNTAKPSIWVNEFRNFGGNRTSIEKSEIFSTSSNGGHQFCDVEGKKTEEAFRTFQNNDNKDESEIVGEAEGKSTEKKKEKENEQKENSNSNEEETTTESTTTKRVIDEPKQKKDLPKMIVHIGSPLMQQTNEIHQAYYNRIIEHRKDTLVETKWAREEARGSTKWH
jgi:hypothetical protein